MDLQHFHFLGNRDLLNLHKVAFLCSRNCPADVVTQACQWADTQREKGLCVISGFHSRVEKEVFYRLLPGAQPMVVVLAKGLKKLDAEFEGPLEKGRLLVVTRYAETVTHASEESCYQRNRLMLDLAQEAVIGYASPGGKLEKLCAEFGGSGKVIRLGGDALVAAADETHPHPVPPLEGEGTFRPTKGKI